MSGSREVKQQEKCLKQRSDILLLVLFFMRSVAADDRSNVGLFNKNTVFDTFNMYRL